MDRDWSISGGVLPKFWLGDRVSLKTVAHRIGTVHGLEWRPQGEFYGRCGWWCRVRWDGGACRKAFWRFPPELLASALMGLHEDSLELEGLR